MTTRDELIVKFTADISEFNRRLGQIESSVTKSTKKINEQTNVMANSFKAAGSLIAGYFGTQALINFAKESVNVAKKTEGVALQFEAAFGSAQKASQEMEYLRATSERLGLVTLDVAGSYAKFNIAALSAGITLEQSRKIFEQFAGAFRVFGLSSFEIQGALKAIEQIASKGVVSMEELRLQLGDRLPGVMNIAAEAMGMTTAEFIDLVSKGLVPANEFLIKFGNQFEKITGKQVEKASTNAAAAFARWENAVNDLMNVLGAPLMNALAGAAEGVIDFTKIMYEGGKGMANFASSVETSGLRQQLDSTIDKLADAQNQFDNGLISPTAKARLKKDIEQYKAEIQGLQNTLSNKKNNAVTYDYEFTVPTAPKKGSAVTQDEVKEYETLKKSLQTVNEVYSKQIALVDKLKEENRITDKEALEMRQKLTEKMDSYNTKIEKSQDKERSRLEKLQEVSYDVSRSIADDLEDAFNRPISSIEDLRGIAINALKEIALQAVITGFGLQNMASPFQAGATKGIGSLIGGAISGLVGTTQGMSPAQAALVSKPPIPRATGGAVESNKLYMVGEREPELFIPKTSGDIVPASKMGGGVTVQQNINISTGVQETVRAELLRSLPAIKQASLDAVVQASKRGGVISQVTGARG